MWLFSVEAYIARLWGLSGGLYRLYAMKRENALSGAAYIPRSGAAFWGRVLEASLGRDICRDLEPLSGSRLIRPP